jgi:hypothetical protein
MLQNQSSASEHPQPVERLDVVKEPYEPPELIEHGKVADLTENTPDSLNDGESNSS